MKVMAADDIHVKNYLFMKRIPSLKYVWLDCIHETDVIGG